MAKRQSLEIAGYTHTNPVPLACKVGNMLYTSSIFGQDVKTGKRAETREQQATFCFENLRLVMEQAGGSTEDVIMVTVYLTSEKSVGDAVNAAWLEMFPDENARPARLNFTGEGDIRIQCVAVLG